MRPSWHVPHDHLPRRSFSAPRETHRQQIIQYRRHQSDDDEPADDDPDDGPDGVLPTQAAEVRLRAVGRCWGRGGRRGRRG